MINCGAKPPFPARDTKVAFGSKAVLKMVDTDVLPLLTQMNGWLLEILVPIKRMTRFVSDALRETFEEYLRSRITRLSIRWG
jgi:hypothetical protein